MKENKIIPVGYADMIKSELMNNAPVLKFENENLDNLIGSAYTNALKNVININTVECKADIYNDTGLIEYPPGLMIRAGGNYETPWTRDAAINSWNAASILEPDIARNTLLAVCKKDENGRFVIQQDNQWWDKVVWITAAWSHYLITGNKDFLKNVYEISTTALDEMYLARFNAEYGLFEGPSFFNDGIAGYPLALYQPGNNSSFVLDHPDTAHIIALSTNCLYFNAYQCVSHMALELNKPKEEIEFFNDFAKSMKESINNRLWNSEKGRYGYFIYAKGSAKGKLDMHQEGMGISFAIIFGVADKQQVESILKNVHMQPKGIVAVWPHFEEIFDDKRPGRHNCITWPLINGFWAHAAALGKRPDILEFEVENIASLVQASNNEFLEVYDSIDGKVTGGWQNGHIWASSRNQTWSATSYIRAIIYGLFGIDFEIDGLRLHPCVPESWGRVSLRKFRYKNMTLNISLYGAGNRIKSFTVNSKKTDGNFLSSGLLGEQSICIEMEK